MSSFDDATANLPRGRNREDVRQHNLSSILRIAHLRGPVTRSQLALHTGLNRSTILDLVTELEDMGLAVSADATASQGVGRPSLSVSASENVVAFAVNPEVDATTVGVVTLGGKVLARERRLMPQLPGPKDSATMAASMIAQFRSQLPAGCVIAGVGVAVPGQVRVADGIIRHAPHLEWYEAPFATYLSQATGLKVSIDNDASIACNAEFMFGSARGFREVVFLFAGSGGIGGGAIIDGRQLRGSSGYAGEFGHVRISNSSSKDYSNLSGTLESQVQRDALLDVFKLFGASDEELEVEIMRARSQEAKSLLRQQIELLGRGIANYVNIFNPEIIVLSGFIASLFKYDPDGLLDSIKIGALEASAERVVIRPAELGQNLLMIGAAELAFEPILARPTEAMKWLRN